jgi:hypothetical protein
VFNINDLANAIKLSSAGEEMTVSVVKEGKGGPGVGIGTTALDRGRKRQAVHRRDSRISRNERAADGRGQDDIAKLK